jgi:hypothetical protein
MALTGLGGRGSGDSGAKYINRHSAHATNSVRYGAPFGRFTTTRSKFCEPHAHSIGGGQSMSLRQVLDEYTGLDGHDEHPARDWIGAVAERLQHQGPTIDPQRLDALALDLWRDERLGAMAPSEAAELWLRPVMPR